MRPVFRPMVATDRAFIAASWSLAWRPDEVSLLPPRSWRAAVYELIESLLQRPGVNVSVVADADSTAGDADAFAYLVTFERSDAPLPLVLFCFVKPGARRSGLATALLKRAGYEPADPIPYACHTRGAAKMRAGKFRAAQWRPDLCPLTYPREEDHDEPDADARIEAARGSEVEAAHRAANALRRSPR